MLDTFLWYSGLLAWLGFGTFGLLVVGDWCIDWVVQSFWTKREFLAFVWDRLKRRKASNAT